MSEIPSKAVAPEVVGPVGGNDPIPAPSAVPSGLPAWLTPELLAAERERVRRMTDEALNSE